MIRVKAKINREPMASGIETRYFFGDSYIGASDAAHDYCDRHGFELVVIMDFDRIDESEGDR